MLYDYYMFDFYSIVHLWWGVMYGYFFSPLNSAFEWGEGFGVAFAVAVVWEIFENNQHVIDTYLKRCNFKICQDSWANMIGDVISSSVGYLLMFLLRDEYEIVMITSSFLCFIALVFCHYISPQNQNYQRNLQTHFDQNGRCDCCSFEP